MRNTVMISEATLNDREVLAQIIRDSFRDVADRFALTKDNCPKHPSNYTSSWIESDILRGVQYFILYIDKNPIGCVGIENPSTDVCYIERLSVLPEMRGRHFGIRLVQYALEYAAWKGACKVSIGIIAEQTELNEWYKMLGFVETQTKSFAHLPFNVCLMEFRIKESADHAVHPLRNSISRKKGGKRMSDKYKRIAIVTGTTSGIGEATMRKFVAAGFGVVGNGRKAEKLAMFENEIGSAFCSVTGDAADTAVLNQLFDLAVDRFGREADIVVANAGRGLGGSVTDADLIQFEDVLKINVSGTLSLIQQAAQKMVRFQQNAFPGSPADIIIIGSVVGRHISPFSAVYGASKFAVHALAEGLRREVGPKGVRVSLVEPGAVLSGFQAAAGYSDEMVNRFHEKFGPLLIGDDIAEAVHYIVNQPPHVHISNIVVRPTRQDYP